MNKVAIKSTKLVSGRKKPVNGNKADLVIDHGRTPTGTLNVEKMAEDAARIEKHVTTGGKLSELSGIKPFKPSGLFNK